MREQLIQYVTLLFAGAQDCADTKQEILQNTLDRYDDLVAQGKSPEAAYRLAIGGIGDINEILGAEPETAVLRQPAKPETEVDEDTLFKKILRAAAIGLYILCPIPLFVLSELDMSIIGLCGTIAIVAIATVLILLGRKKTTGNERRDTDDDTDICGSPRQELRKGINSLIWAIGLAVYFIVSFATMAWYVTWVIFPIIAAVQGLVRAILDLLEVNHHEN